MTDESVRRPNEQDAAETADTARTETLSDGVYAIAMTLLVLTIHVPTKADVARHGGLTAALLGAWPTYLAYVGTFLTLAVSWISHHGSFVRIARLDTRTQWWNMLVLLAVALAPFPTELLATYLSDGIGTASARTASVVFGIVSTLRPLFLLQMWGHLRRRPELLVSRLDADYARHEQRRAAVGVLLYGLGAAAGLVIPIATISATVVVSLFFALTTTRSIDRYSKQQRRAP